MEEIIKGTSELADIVLEHIPKGHKNGISKSELQKRCGFGERMVRKLIEIASTSEHPVINLQDGHGYFIPEDNEKELVKKVLSQEKSRANHILKRVEMCEVWLSDRGERESDYSGVNGVNVRGYFRRKKGSAPECEGQIEMDFGGGE